jgi:hypothetical protein
LYSEPPPGSFAELFLAPLSVDIGDCKVTSKKDGRFDLNGHLLFSVVFISRGAVLQVVGRSAVPLSLSLKINKSLLENLTAQRQRS